MTTSFSRHGFRLWFVVVFSVLASAVAGASANANAPCTEGQSTTESVVVGNVAAPSSTERATSRSVACTLSNVVVAPEVTVTMSANPASFVVGVFASYTLQLTNTGTVATTAVATITDVIPVGLTIGALPAGCAAAGQTVTCSVPAAMVPGASTGFLIPVTATAAAPTSVTNTATVTGGGDAACPAAARCSSSVTTVVNRPQLTLSKAAGAASMAVGTPASFTLALVNTGTAATTAASIISDPFPTGLTVGALPLGCTAAAQTVTCSVATGLAAGGGSSFVIPVTPTLAAANSITNTATASGGGDATCPAATRCSASAGPVAITGLSDLTISKTHAGNFAAGQVGASYAITVSNIGVGDKLAGAAVTVTDTPSSALTIRAIGGTGWTCATLTSCTRSDILPSGASYPPISVTVDVAFLASTPQLNSATVVTSASEMNTGNNAASDSTTIVAGNFGSLSVTRGGSGSGSVVSLDGAINCGVACASGYVDGSVVRLTAAPAPGSVFTGWLGGCIGTGACAVTIAGASAVSATFALTPFGSRILDVDSNVAYAPETDGLLVLRFLLGMRGIALSNLATGSGATRTGEAALLSYLSDALPYLDVDGNGRVDALTDGVMILRKLVGVPPASIATGAHGPGATRTAEQIDAYIQTLMQP